MERPKERQNNIRKDRSKERHKTDPWKVSRKGIMRSKNRSHKTYKDKPNEMHQDRPKNRTKARLKDRISEDS